jgi:predicted nucleic acid-binding protein
MSGPHSPKIYYWDSSVFCAFFSQEPNRTENVAQILEEAESGEVIIVTSFMTLTEVIKLDGAKPTRVEDQKLITQFFKKDYFEWVNFDRGIAEAARELMWAHDGVKSKDAVHIASAVEVTAMGVKLDALHAYDGAFAKLSGKIAGLKCQMGEPMPSQMTMALGDARKKKRRKKK